MSQYCVCARPKGAEAPLQGPTLGPCVCSYSHREGGDDVGGTSLHARATQLAGARTAFNGALTHTKKRGGEKKRKEEKRKEKKSKDVASK